MSLSRKLAVLAGSLVIAVVPASAQAAPKKKAAPPKQHAPKQCKKQKKCPPKPGNPVVQGRMTGQGHTTTAEYGVVKWRLRDSVCNANRFPDMFVDFGDRRFILESYSSPLTCFTLIPPTSVEGNPRAGFDSIRAQGTGTLDGVPGANITFRFTDAGEPGRNDSTSFTITEPNSSAVAISVENLLATDGGNMQAHRR